ncbi:MAG: leucine-rich repeat domain-containing protein [Treponema sp.]|jgi:hypothetical protein|nr:leucine-rich repeat domain-containing protein [Treponema sp.]
MNKKIIFWLFIITFLFFSSCSNRQPSQISEQQSDANNQLISVIRPNGVTHIYDANNKLRSVIFPDGASHINEDSYSNGQLTSVTIPESIWYIGKFAFANNELTSVVIPNRVGEIEKSTFKNNKLTSVVIPNRVTRIGESAFAKNQLTGITLPNKLFTVEKMAFANNRLTSVVIPDSVSRIYESAFTDNQLTSVIIPDRVISIGEYAFSNNLLTSITISAKVILDDTAFDDRKFIDFYRMNGSKAGVYTFNKGEWNVSFFEEQAIEPEIDGTYEIKTAYSNIYNHFAMYEVETEKQGTKITIDGNKAIFGDEEYQLFDSVEDWYGKYAKYGIMDYNRFLDCHAGLNYNGFDGNIIGKDYTGGVKIKSMKNDRNEYGIFFAGNKLIIDVSAFVYDHGRQAEIERKFLDLIRSDFDHFFYIAERL